MGRNITNREGAALSEQQKKPVSQVERANPSDRQIRTEKRLYVQQVLVSVKFNRKPILISRRSFSEIARSQEPTIIYIEENEHDARKILVIFNPTTKTYKILSFQFSSSTRTNSSIEIEPSTEEGQAWVQCLQQAYPYYDFENAEILPNYQKLAKTLINQWMLEQLQQIKVSVQFGERKLLVSRRSFSEIARSQAPTIIHKADDNHGIRTVFVSFNPTTKTYKILSFQFSNSTRTNSSIEIEPSTKEGQAWIQCLQQAYPYYDFENAEILNEYKYYENLLDPFSISLPKIIERQDDQLQAFEQSGSVVKNLLYSRISYETLERSFPRLYWFDPYTYTHYVFLFDVISRKYKLIYRYRKEQFLYTVTIELQEINKETGYIKFSKEIIKQTQTLKPRGSRKSKTHSSKKDSNAQQQPENQLPKPIYDHLVSTITTVLQDKFSSTKILESFVKATIAEMIQKLPAEKLNLNYLDKSFCENFIEKNKVEIVGKILPNKPGSELTNFVLMEDKHPELIALINLLHSAYPDYDFDLGKVKDKK